MKYLITGAGGQLGTEWKRWCEQRDSDFVAYGSSELDITDRKTVQMTLKKEQPDVVINCAAYTKVDDAEEFPEKAFEVNEYGVMNLAEACAIYNIKLVHYSTDYVFPGRAEDRQRYPDGYPEDADTAPVNVYGASKRGGEQQLMRKAGEWLLIRVSWLCGPGGKNFINTMLNMSDNRDTLQVVDDQMGSPSFTFDVVDKTVRLLDDRQEGIFHISSKGLISWADFAGEIFRESGKRVTVERVSSDHFPAKAVRPAFSYLSNSKAEDSGLRVLDWKSGLSDFLQKQKQSL